MKERDNKNRYEKGDFWKGQVKPENTVKLNA